MLSDYNKSNQLVILLRDIYDELYSKLILTVKRIVVFSVILFITSVIWSILTNNMIYVYMTTIILMIVAALSSKNVKACRIKTVEKIFGGEKYSIININNEQMLNLIGKLNNAMGRLDITNNVILYLMLTGIVQMVIINLVIYYM